MTLYAVLAGVRAESALYLDGSELTVYIGCMGGSNLYLKPTAPLPAETLREDAAAVQGACEELSLRRQRLFDRPYYRENWSRERSVICYAYPNDPERPIMVAFYTLPGEGREEMCAMLEAALAARLGGRLDRYGLHYREPWFEPAFTPPETSLVRHLTEAARAALCREPRINTISKQDSFVLTNHAGIPTVSWGGTMKTIGRGAYHHPDENMPVDEAWAATRTACDAVRRWLEEE